MGSRHRQLVRLAGLRIAVVQHGQWRRARRRVAVASGTGRDCCAPTSGNADPHAVYIFISKVGSRHERTLNRPYRRYTCLDLAGTGELGLGALTPVQSTRLIRWLCSRRQERGSVVRIHNVQQDREAHVRNRWRPASTECVQRHNLSVGRNAAFAIGTARCINRQASHCSGS